MQKYSICDMPMKIHDHVMFLLPSPSGGVNEPFVQQDCADWKHEGHMLVTDAERGGGICRWR